MQLVYNIACTLIHSKVTDAQPTLILPNVPVYYLHDGAMLARVYAMAVPSVCLSDSLCVIRVLCVKNG